ncbi:WD40 repeat domain-containing protein [Actinoplanes sp. NPDC051861]|uniref:WD40 repeat domain-containing protein n=1 Tax=Actinoplanes sp. NPDC051861 TaxID=3155170 RepID=UPI00341214AF
MNMDGIAVDDAETDSYPKRLWCEDSGEWAVLGANKRAFLWRPGESLRGLLLDFAGNWTIEILDRRRLAAVDENHIQIWDVAADPVRLFRCDARVGNVSMLASPLDGRWLASTGNDYHDGWGNVSVWSTSDPSWIAVFSGQDRNVVSALVADPQGEWLVAGDVRGCVRTIDMRTLEESSMPLHGAAIECAAPRPDGSLVAFGADSDVVIWRVEDKSLVRMLNTRQGGLIAAVAWSPDGTRVAAVRAAGSLDIWDVASGRLTARLRLDCTLRSVSWRGDLITMNGSRGPVLVRGGAVAGTWTRG